MWPYIVTGVETLALGWLVWALLAPSPRDDEDGWS